MPSVAHKSPRSSSDHAVTAASSSPKKAQHSTPPRSQENTSSQTSNPGSEPVSRTSSPAPLTSSPHRDPYARYIQQTIDNYATPSLQNSLQQVDEDLRMQNEDPSTPTQSTAPSECGSQDSERSYSRLKPPGPPRRRKSSAARSAGERDDGGCLLPSPPPPLRKLSLIQVGFDN